MLLKAQGVSHAFDYPLYEGITLDFPQGTSTAIVGVSGCGKSTFLHNLSSFLPPLSGEIFYKDRSIYTLSSDELVMMRRYDFGMIFQHHYLFHGLSGAENLAVSSLLIQEKLDEEMIEGFGLTSLLPLPMGSLSGGQQQRLSIARVLAKKPKVIFADEPTGNLDQATATVVMDLLAAYIKRYNASLILVTHDHHLAQSCNFCFEMKEHHLTPLVWN